ncbi:MAG: aldo/keto reductase [Actinomycetes bacterium]
MPLSQNRESRPELLTDRALSISVIHAALDAGINFLDTADIYAPSWRDFGHNEKLVGEALRSWSGSVAQKSKVVIATKGGITRGPNESWGRASSRDYFLRAAEASALRLGVEKIQLWQHHRMNPEMPFETQFKNVMVLLERGLVEHIGLSNVNLEQLKFAVEIGGSVSEGGVISVQNEFSPRYRLGSDVIEYCQSQGIAYLPWSPLGGVGRSSGIADGKFGLFNELSQEKDCSPYSLAIAWQLSQSSTIIPIPGASRREQIADLVAGWSLKLSDEELTKLNSNLPENPPLHPELVDQPPLRAPAV